MGNMNCAETEEETVFSFAAPAQMIVDPERIATIHRRLARQMQRCEPIAIRDVPFSIPIMQKTVQWHTHRTSDAGLC